MIAMSTLQQVAKALYLSLVFSVYQLPHISYFDIHFGAIFKQKTK